MNKLGFGFLRLPQKKHGSVDYEKVNEMVDLYKVNKSNKSIRCKCTSFVTGCIVSDMI